MNKRPAPWRKRNAAAMYELVAIIDGRIVGSAEFPAKAVAQASQHRARFGTVNFKEYWGGDRPGVDGCEH